MTLPTVPFLSPLWKSLHFQPVSFKRTTWMMTTMVLICILFIVLAIPTLGQRRLPHEQIGHSRTWGGEMKAPRVDAMKLMSEISVNETVSGPNAINLSRVPGLLHQSWKTSQITSGQARWSDSCRGLNPSWSWVLWSDGDNLEMTGRFFPWFLETFRALPAGINRADVARNMYLFLFGGVYADLDVECLKGFDGVFGENRRGNEGEDGGVELNGTISAPATAFLGRMDYDSTDRSYEHTVPNAWMASTPRHPFWLFVLENLKAKVAVYGDEVGRLQTEDITGPMALWRDLREWIALTDKGVDVGKMMMDNPTHLLLNSSETKDAGVPRIVMLPFTTIYPFAWNNAGKRYRSVCQSFRKTFDADLCKKKVTNDDSYAISYWSHSWDMD